MVPKKIRNIIHKFELKLAMSEFPNIRILIFGSYARGDARPDSDIDLCLVSEAFSKNKEAYRKKAVVIAFMVDPRFQIVLASPREIRSNSLSPLFSSVYKESVAV